MESVWDYPRPPRVEPCRERVVVVVDDEEIAASERALRVLETSHPPGIYIPPEDIADGALQATARWTVCEYKGRASYYDVRGRRAAAWAYHDPVPGYAQLRGHVAFYPGRMDACFVGDERVTPQEGDFYGGWLTSGITGPFKGGSGTWGW